MISPYEFSALSRQILMSVQPKPVRVMSTLTAQTVKVLTAVLVNRDLLEMGQYVKVNQDNQLIRNLFFSFINLGGKTLLAKFFKYSNLIMKFYKKIRFPSKVDQKTDLEELDSPKMNSGVSILGELVFFSSTDVDECSAESTPCDSNADCSNSDGSFRCTCKQGFTGDGRVCQG